MKKILIINNDTDTMSLLKKWLEKKSYQVRFTEDKDEVPHLIKEFSPELIIVDVMQNEVVENLKKFDGVNGTPVLLMTGYTNRSKDSRMPVDAIIEKPFDLNLLEKKIEKLITSQGSMSLEL